MRFNPALPTLVRAISVLASVCIAGPTLAQAPAGEAAPLPEGLNQVQAPAPNSPAPPNGQPTAPAHAVPKELREKVQALQQRADYDAALKLISDALAQQTNNPELYLLRAGILCRVGRPTPCLEDAVRAVDADKAYVPSYLFRAMAKVDANQAKEAIADCEFVIGRWPQRPLGYNCIGVVHRALRDYAAAAKSFDEAIAKDGKFALAHYNKGLTYALENDHDRAISSFTAALDVNEKYDEAYARRGKARMAKGDSEGARADFASALRLNGRNYTAGTSMQALQIGKALDVLSGKTER